MKLSFGSFVKIPSDTANFICEIKAINYMEISVMDKEKKGKAEEAAEKTGEVIGKGVKKGWGVVKGFGKGMKEGVTKKKK